MILHTLTHTTLQSLSIATALLRKVGVSILLLVGKLALSQLDLQLVVIITFIYTGNSIETFSRETCQGVGEISDQLWEGAPKLVNSFDSFVYAVNQDKHHFCI